MLSDGASRSTVESPKRGFYHDGRFATLSDVISHYESCMKLGLTNQEKEDLVEFVKSLPAISQH